MNPQKEILDQYDQLKIRFDKLNANDTKKNGKFVKLLFNFNYQNIKSLTGKDYELAQNQLMNYFNDLVMRQDNIQLIMQAKLDLKIWNLLTERVSKILKIKIDPTHLGKNSHVIIQNLYSTLIEDLRNNFQFFRNIYFIICNYDEKDINILISNILNFMGDIKKLKLILNKQFSEFKETINIEGDNKKNAMESLRFFNYALNNNPYNTRIYSNLGFVYREFLNDHLNSAYWFVRALACVDNELKKVKDNLEKDFNSIRKIFLKMDYIVDNNTGFLKYDLDYLPILFYRLQGILYMNIDVDKLDNLMSNFGIIIQKILQNYSTVPENHKFNYEINGQIEQMILLCIFNFHHNLNGLADYSNDSEKMVFENIKRNPALLNIRVYNHRIMKELENVQSNEIKKSFKFSMNFITNFIRSICSNMSEENITFIEKFLLVIFYWFSLNYDIFDLIIDEEMRRQLKYFNYVIQKDVELKRLIYNQEAFKNVLDKINKMIMPVEVTFFGFIPLNRYFVLNPKRGVLKVDDIKEISIINRIILIHLLDSFNLFANDDDEVSMTFWKKSNVNVKETTIYEVNASTSNDLKEKLSIQHKMISLNVKKVKPMILLDACNIAMRHGDHTFSTKGIQIVMDYFTRQGHKVLSFLPEYLFRSQDSQNFSKKKRVVPDDIEYLKRLYLQALVVQTPAQDYDDSYCIQYAKQNNAFIVTNDMFRDFIENRKDQRIRETEKMWVKEKCVSFTFNKDEFIPNPDSAFFNEFNIVDYNRVTTDDG